MFCTDCRTEGHERLYRFEGPKTVKRGAKITFGDTPAYNEVCASCMEGRRMSGKIGYGTMELKNGE